MSDMCSCPAATNRSVLSIAIKFMGIKWVVGGLYLACQIYWGLYGYRIPRSEHQLVRPLYDIIQFLPMAVDLLLGMLCLVFAGTLAKALIRDERIISSKDISSWVRDMFGVALRVYGVFLILSNLPALIAIITSRIGIPDSSFQGLPMSWALPWYQCANELATLGIGLLLTIFATQIVQLIYGPPVQIPLPYEEGKISEG